MSSERHHHPAKGPRVLVVDDSPSNRLLYGAVLRKAGYEVELATTGAEALAACDARPTDLVLLDFMMPVMDGAAVVRELRTREATRSLPVIVLTASAANEAVAAALAAGADDYVTKPIAPAKLIDRVQSALAIGRSSSPPAA